jgi:hypothetical protein
VTRASEKSGPLVTGIRAGGRPSRNSCGELDKWWHFRWSTPVRWTKLSGIGLVYDSFAKPITGIDRVPNRIVQNHLDDAALRMLRGPELATGWSTVIRRQGPWHG